MKKMLMVVVVLCMVSAMFAVDFSIGGRAGLGLSMLRGADYTDTVKNIPDTAEEFNMAYTAGIDALIGITPLFALETGIGFVGAGEVYTTGSGATEYSVSMARGELYIPVLARVQTEYDMGSIGGITYFATGAQVGINIVGEDGYIFTQDENLDTTKIVDANAINFDIPVALGQEFRFGANHYVGLRAQYNINLTNPIKEPSVGSQMYDEWFHDNFLAAVTYRYAF